MDYYLAIDIGAASGRHMIGYIDNGKIIEEEIFRFDTHSEKKGDKWIWECEALVENVIKGMEVCKQLGKIPTMLGIDAWGADYVLLDRNGDLLCNAADYRDEMTLVEMMFEADNIIPYDEYYKRTGIARMPIDTIYQLMLLQKRYPEVLEKAGTLLMIPSFINYKLTGIVKQEYTSAVTTGLINANTQRWDHDTIKALGLPIDIFTELYAPGEFVGRLSEEVIKRVGFDCSVVLPAAHDTASAFFAIPSTDNNSVSVSSGTWSILGIVNDKPLNSPEAMAAGLTNEGAYPKQYRLSKNIIGMFMFESIRRNLGGKQDYLQLIKMAQQADEIKSVVDMSNLMFLIVPDMIGAIKEACIESGQKVPETAGEVLQVFFNSLVSYYEKTIKDIEEVTGRKFKSFNIVGGGSLNDYLNLLAAKTTGLPVLAGPSEATITGNLMCQMIAGGEFAGIDDAKTACAETFPVKRFS